MVAPAVTFGATAHFGAFTGWNYTGPGSTSDENGIAEAKDAKGNTVADSQINQKTPVSSSLDCADDTNTIPANIGDIVNSIVLESIQINLNKGSCAKMTLSGHNHATNPHTASIKAAHGMTVATAFGAADVLGGTAGDNACVESVSINISCGHTDEADQGGYDHFAGENNGGKITVTQTWLGVPTTAYDTAAWTGTATQTTDVNTGAVRTIVNVTKFLVLA